MGPKKPSPQSEHNLFRLEQTNLINRGHELVTTVCLGAD